MGMGVALSMLFPVRVCVLSALRRFYWNSRSNLADLTHEERHFITLQDLSLILLQICWHRSPELDVAAPDRMRGRGGAVTAEQPWARQVLDGSLNEPDQNRGKEGSDAALQLKQAGLRVYSGRTSRQGLTATVRSGSKREASYEGTYSTCRECVS